jgi:hypothetical protein
MDSKIDFTTSFTIVAASRTGATIDPEHARDSRDSYALGSGSARGVKVAVKTNSRS